MLSLLQIGSGVILIANSFVCVASSVEWCQHCGTACHQYGASKQHSHSGPEWANAWLMLVVAIVFPLFL